MQEMRGEGRRRRYELYIKEPPSPLAVMNVLLGIYTIDTELLLIHFFSFLFNHIHNLIPTKYKLLFSSSQLSH